MNKDHKQFLDNVRDSGLINMYGAAPSLIKEFGMSKSEARSVLQKWMVIAD